MRRFVRSASRAIGDRDAPFCAIAMGRRTHKGILRLVKAFLRAGVLSEEGQDRATITGTSARWRPLTAARQHRPVRSGRALRTKVGSARPGMDTRQASPCRCPGHETRPLRGRLRGHDRRHPRRRRSAPGRGGIGARSDGPAPIGGEDEGLPHRRGVRLPRLAHPAPSRRGRAGKKAVYTYPSKKALASVMAKVRSLTAEQSIERSPT